METIDDVPRKTGPAAPSSPADPAFLLETLLRHTPDFVYFKDRESRFLAASEELARFFGVPAGEVAGKADADLTNDTFTPDLAAASRAAEEVVMTSGEAAIDIEESRPLADGTPRWVSATKIPMRDREQRIIGTFGMSRDITGRKLAEERIRASAARLERIVETQRGIAQADLDPQAVMGLICERTRELTGADGVAIAMLDGDDLDYRSAIGFLEPLIDTRTPIDGSLGAACLAEGRPVLIPELEVDSGPTGLRSTGARSVIVAPLQKEQDVIGVLSVASLKPGSFDDEDVTALELLGVVLSAALSHAAEFEAKRAQVELLARFAAMYERAAIGIALVDRRGLVVECNPALEEMLSFSEEELVGRSLNDHTYSADITADAVAFDQLMHGECDFYRLEKRYLARNTDVIWGHLSVSLVRDADGEPQFAIVMIENITARKEAEQQLREQAERSEYQALHDALTDLPNRVLFADRLQQALLASERNYATVVVLMIDLDGFKEINDVHGHHAGDLVLQAIGDRLAGGVRSSDTVGRLGGDEFGVVLPEWAPDADIATFVGKLAAAIDEPIDAEGVAVSVGASIGIARFRDDATDAEGLLRRADEAMYKAKRNGWSFVFAGETPTVG
jgi:diguanylate cyclase (GGDEF)-like protein/PAS domain S-box-containing protein